MEACAIHAMMPCHLHHSPRQRGREGGRGKQLRARLPPALPLSNKGTEAANALSVAERDPGGDEERRSGGGRSRLKCRTGPRRGAERREQGREEEGRQRWSKQPFPACLLQQPRSVPPLLSNAQPIPPSFFPCSLLHVLTIASSRLHFWRCLRPIPPSLPPSSLPPSPHGQLNPKQ
jgi:hypothetical protein